MSECVRECVRAYVCVRVCAAVRAGSRPSEGGQMKLAALIKACLHDKDRAYNLPTNLSRLF